MRYLKSYKIFESSEDQYSEIKSYLSQIFLELEDVGCKIDISETWSGENPLKLAGIKINLNMVEIGDKDTEDILPAIESSINYMSSEGFTNYWIIVEDYSKTVGKLNIDELETYLNLQKSLANPSYKNYYRRSKKSLELNFRK